jgi:alpha-amylase
VGVLNVPKTISWADTQRDISAWLGNDMQRLAFKKMKEVQNIAKKNKDLLHIWRLLQTSDHFYYMSTKWFKDGDIHKYFNPFNSPYEAFLNYVNIIEDLKANILRTH